MNDGYNQNSGGADSEDDKSFNWKDQLGDLVSNDRLSGFTSIRDLAKAYVDLPPPAKVPESVDGYKLPDTVRIEGLRSMALDNKLTQEQLEGLIKFHEGLTKKSLEDVKNQRTKAEQKLRDEWGDEYDNNLKTAKGILKSEAGKEISELLKTSGMANDPKVIKFLHTIGMTMKEGGHIGDDSNVRKSNKSRAERLFPNHPVKKGTA